MKPEEQRIAIAGACGIILQHGTSVAMFVRQIGTTTELYHSINDLPNYLEDLNACHEMEKVLTEQQWVTYVEDYILDAGTEGKPLSYVGANAPQRCEAFLHTLGLWNS